SVYRATAESGVGSGGRQQGRRGGQGRGRQSPRLPPESAGRERSDLRPHRRRPPARPVRLCQEAGGGGMRALTACLLLFAVTMPVAAASFDWGALEKEAIATLQAYVRIDTSNPPGDVRKAADFLEALLKKEAIETTRYESGEGRSIILARLKGAG